MYFRDHGYKLSVLQHCGQFAEFSCVFSSLSVCPHLHCTHCYASQMWMMTTMRNFAFYKTTPGIDFKRDHEKTCQRSIWPISIPSMSDSGNANMSHGSNLHIK